MTEITKIIVENVEGRERADKYLVRVFPELSRAGIHRAFDAGLVRRDGVSLTKNTKVMDGEELEFSEPEVVSSALVAVSIPLEIIFEDEHLLAINKESGMVVHPGAGTDEGTLVHALLARGEGDQGSCRGIWRGGERATGDRGTRRQAHPTRRAGDRGSGCGGVGAGAWRGV